MGKKLDAFLSFFSTQSQSLFSGLEKLLVYLICIGVLVFVGRELVANVATTDSLYTTVIANMQNASDASVAGRDRLTTTVAAVGMRDMSILRSAVLFVGFIVVLTGCVFVLKGVEAAYKLQLTSDKKRASLSTASPGLVLITAGIVLVIIALRQESTVDLRLAGGTPASVAKPQSDDEPSSGREVQETREVLDVSK